MTYVYISGGEWGGTSANKKLTKAYKQVLFGASQHVTEVKLCVFDLGRRVHTVCPTRRVLRLGCDSTLLLHIFVKSLVISLLLLQQIGRLKCTSNVSVLHDNS